MTLVAACQVALDVTDPAGNRERLEAAVVEAAGRGAELVVLPELGPCGYAFADADEARAVCEPADGRFVRGLEKLSDELGVTVVAGFGEQGGDGRLYNSAAVVWHGALQEVYRKAHLWDREKLIFTPGDARPPVLDAPVGRLGVVICYDLEFPEWLRSVALDGAQLVAAPTNWPAEPRPAGERPMEVVRVQAAASVNHMIVVAADRCGTERGVEWVGGSVITGLDGFPLAGPAETGRPVVLLAEVSPKDADDKRISERNDVLGDRRPELYRRD